jgi:hypothetical protein
MNNCTKGDKVLDRNTGKNHPHKQRRGSRHPQRGKQAAQAAQLLRQKHHWEGRTSGDLDNHNGKNGKNRPHKRHRRCGTDNTWKAAQAATKFS